MPTFRHKRIRRFKVLNYVFDNFLLTIRDDQVDDFLEVIDGLPAAIRRSIVQVTDTMREVPVGQVKRVSRDNLSTRDIRDVPKDAAAATASLTKPEPDDSSVKASSDDSQANDNSSNGSDDAAAATAARGDSSKPSFTKKKQ